VYCVRSCAFCNLYFVVIFESTSRHMLATGRASRIRKPTWKADSGAALATLTREKLAEAGTALLGEGAVYAEPICGANAPAGFWGASGDDALVAVTATCVAVPEPLHPKATIESRGLARPLVLDFDQALPQDELGPNERKGAWSQNEDDLLRQAVAVVGPKHWARIAKSLPGRISKQCRERWHNHIDPDICKDAWTEREDEHIWEAVKRLGRKWSVIALEMPGRRDNQIKNRYNCALLTRNGPKSRHENERPHWTTRERAALRRAVPRNARADSIDWEAVASKVAGRRANACRMRWLRANEARAKFEPISTSASVDVETGAPIDAPIDVPIDGPIEPPAIDANVDLMAYEKYDDAWSVPSWTQSHRLRWGSRAAFHFKFAPPVTPMWVRRPIPKMEMRDTITGRFLAQKRREEKRAQKAELMVMTLFA